MNAVSVESYRSVSDFDDHKRTPWVSCNACDLFQVVEARAIVVDENIPGICPRRCDPSFSRTGDKIRP